ncbi:DNA polymerase epsilon catalytic subunit A [Arachis hypogaea]|nr:DNA polymerase epsilon catalytic subunit A [Arachis hypogaea]
MLKVKNGLTAKTLISSYPSLPPSPPPSSKGASSTNSSLDLVAMPKPLTSTPFSDTADLQQQANPAESEPKSGSDASSRIEEVSEWLAKTFEATGKPVTEFEYTPRSISHLHDLLIVSKAKDEAARLVARDFHQKASEYRSQGQYFDQVTYAHFTSRTHYFRVMSMFLNMNYQATDTVINGAGKLKLGQSAISVEDTLKIIICRKQHKKLYSLEMELAAARNKGFVLKQLLETNGIYFEGKPLVMIGVITTFGRQKNRDAIRNVWMGSGGFNIKSSFFASASLKKLEDRRALLHDFENCGNNQDKDIDRENRLTNDFLILPPSIVSDEVCAACDFNHPGKTCLRKLEWAWDGETFMAKKSDYYHIKKQIESDFVDGANVRLSKSFLDLSKTEQQSRLKDRLKKYCQKIQEADPVTGIRFNCSLVLVEEYFRNC